MAQGHQKENAVSCMFSLNIFTYVRGFYVALKYLQWDFILDFQGRLILFKVLISF